MWVSRVGQIEKRGVECRGPVNMQAPRGHGAGACTLWGSHYARSRQQLLSSSPLHILETPLDSLSFTSEKRTLAFVVAPRPMETVGGREVSVQY